MPARRSFYWIFGLFCKRPVQPFLNFFLRIFLLFLLILLVIYFIFYYSVLLWLRMVLSTNLVCIVFICSTFKLIVYLRSNGGGGTQWRCHKYVRGYLFKGI